VSAQGGASAAAPRTTLGTSQDPQASADPVALIPECEECGRPWLLADRDRWRAYLDDEHTRAGSDVEDGEGAFAPSPRDWQLELVPV
jgi:hypothetical protein